jgi:hypothetical protein
LVVGVLVVARNESLKKIFDLRKYYLVTNFRRNKRKAHFTNKIWKLNPSRVQMSASKRVETEAVRIEETPLTTDWWKIQENQ